MPFDKNSSDFAWLVGQFTDIFSVLVSLIFALTFTVILWQIANGWILNGGNETKQKEARTTIVIGVVALVVMASVWGIVALLQSSIF